MTQAAFSSVWSGVVTQQVRSGFWKHLGWSCDAAASQKQFWKDLGRSRDAAEGEK